MIFLSKYFTSDTFLTQARIITLTELMTYLLMPALVQAWHVPSKNSTISAAFVCTSQVTGRVGAC